MTQARQQTDLCVLVKMSPADLASRRHSLAECSGYESRGVCCKKPVRYRMTVAFDVGHEEFLDTVYFCKSHKPKC
jgi:hypothetical protein